MERAWTRNEVAVSPVIATILMVAITVVLAAVLYAMVTIWLVPPEPVERVEMTSDYVGKDIWEVRITSTTRSEELFQYMVVILKNGTKVYTIDPLEETDAGDYKFTDLDGRGGLSSGDRFYITCDRASTYELSVIWRESGSERGSVTWET